VRLDSFFIDLLSNIVSVELITFDYFLLIQLSKCLLHFGFKPSYRRSIFFKIGDEECNVS